MLKLISCIIITLCVLSSSIIVFTQEYSSEDAGNLEEAKEENEDSDGDEDEALPERDPSIPFPYVLSPTYLSYLAEVETEVYKEVKNYAEELKESLRLAEIYLEDYKASSINALNHLPEDVDIPQRSPQEVFHPLIPYRMICRFSQHFQNLKRHMDKMKELDSQMEERLKKLGMDHWPKEKDHEEAIDAILRVHYFYNLDIKQLTKGNIASVPTETKVQLTTAQTFNIAEYAVRKGYFTLAMDWLKTTEYKIKKDNDTSALTVTPLQVADAYKQNIKLHDRDFKKNLYRGHMYIYDRKIKSKPNVKRIRNVKIKHYVTDIKSGVSSDSEANFYYFVELCNGKNFQTEKVKSKLTCWLERKRHPYFAVNPLKMELLSQEPLLLQIYDMISDKWINYIRTVAMPHLDRESQDVVPVRTAAYALLSQEQIPDIPLSPRIELITGLNVRSKVGSEPLRIGAYAFGGHVSPHLDWLVAERDLVTNGNWISNLLIYMTDSQKGGLTAFPSIGVHAKPVKGSAIFWYTGFKNGSVDDRMLHAACPVILGTKWIATQRSFANDNMWKRPCSLDPHAIDTI